MKRFMFVAIAALFATACGGGGTTVADDVTPVDDQQTGDGGGDVQADVPFGCTTAADCIGKEVPGACEKVDCVNNECAIVPVLNGTVCDDGNSCTDADQCFQKECKGTDKACSDTNECTNDACNSATGQCEFTPNTDGCDDGNVCTEGEACLNGQCTGGQNKCECATDADCEKADDGNPCTGIVKCTNNACKVDPGTIIDCANENVGACQEPYCDPIDGACKGKNVPDGDACDDQDKCTEKDVCAAGKCGGDAVKCDDGGECTNDLCDPATGCVFAPVADGTECNDGSLCTENDACAAGKCTGDEVAGCSGCTADADCAEFEDGNLCNGTLKCLEGKCDVDPATVAACEKPGTCKQSLCNPLTGLCEESPALDGAPCDDLNFCTHSDYCSGGVCKGLPVNCDDKSACTTDSCNPDKGCEYAAKTGSCGDGDSCTINDHCLDGKCVGDPNPECQCETDEDCVDDEDGDACNGTLVCKSKKCVVDSKTVVDCTIQGLDSCMLNVCEPETGACVLSSLPDGDTCDDLNACTDADKCYAGICKGAPKFCDDGNICTDDSCDVNIGCVYAHNTTPCDDGSICTLNDQCDKGFCTGDPNPECVCQTDKDCIPFDDGNTCNGKLVCKAFKCMIDPTSVVLCDKTADTDCLVTYCNPETGQCVQSKFEDGKPCSDKNACTLADTCKAGKCEGTGAPVCKDDNVCTDDQCDPSLGCIYPPNSAACDDGDPCTGGDTCANGVCQPGQQDLCGGQQCLPDWTMVCGGADSWGNNKSGATDVVDKYPCSEWDNLGPEYTYTFTAPYDCTVNAALSKETGETDIFVLDNLGAGCDPEQCITWDFATVTFEAAAGVSYYIVVDGYEDGFFDPEGTWTLTVTCIPKTEIVCNDGVDDDQDGDTDCDDDDCFGTDACPLPLCSPDWFLSCGSVDYWANYNVGATDVIQDYPACNSWVYDGPEYAYVFDTDVAGTVTVTLTDETAETDVLVLTDADDACDPTNCVAWGFSEAQFAAEAGKTYYVIVDGWAGAEGSYTLNVTCE